ncbi:hypothetical protein [Streptomyces olivochromogenes]|uniref:hypothetical protein n=1 Tax=Streptomyces olivochromogenes TaxID=1963 RepID=UPI00368229F4
MPEPQIEAVPRARRGDGGSEAEYTVCIEARTSSGGAQHNTSYDIWDNDHQYEIMLWVNYNGSVGPIGT